MDWYMQRILRKWGCQRGNESRHADGFKTYDFLVNQGFLTIFRINCNSCTIKSTCSSLKSKFSLMKSSLFMLTSPFSIIQSQFSLMKSSFVSSFSIVFVITQYPRHPQHPKQTLPGHGGPRVRDMARSAAPSPPWETLPVALLRSRWPRAVFGSEDRWDPMGRIFTIRFSSWILMLI